MTDDPAATERSILVRLKNETRPEHDAIEGTLDLMSEGLTLANYCRQLEAFWGFYQPVEMRLEQIAGWAEYGIDLGARRKADWIIADLEALRAEPADRLPICSDLPQLRKLAEGFGCLYVLEGSTLGGQYISRHVGAVLGVTPERGGRFFHAYGERTGTMWREMGRALTSFASDRATEDRMIASALATFRTLRCWFQERRVV